MHIPSTCQCFWFKKWTFFCAGPLFASANGIKDLIRKIESAMLYIEYTALISFFALSKFSLKLDGLSYELVKGD